MIRFLFCLSCGLALALLAVAGHTAITSSPHDFSAFGWSGGEICKPCHTPHNAKNGAAGTVDEPLAPLWNHSSTTASYTLYSSPTMDEPVNQPGPASKSCLSCHDGTVAIDAFGGSPGGTMMTGTAMLSTDLRDDHPIGVPWIHQTEITNCYKCHQISSMNYIGPPFFETGGEMRVECATCHDVHNTTLPGEDHMLNITIAGSTLCLTCHHK